jgi:hypothetical protein
VIDGVFTETANGELTFHPAQPPTEAELTELLAHIRTRILRGRRTEALHEGHRTRAAAACSSLAGTQTVKA